MATPSEEELRARIAGGSREPDDYEELARVLGATGRFEESLAVLRSALELELAAQDRARISMELGWGLYEEGPRRQGEALLLARQAAALLEGQATSAEMRSLQGTVQCLLAYCLWWSDERSAQEAGRLAVEALEAALEETPDAEWAGWARYDTGRAYTLLSEGQKAIPHIQAFLSGDLLAPDRLSGVIVLAEAFRLAARLEEAGQAVEEGLRLASGTPNALPVLYQTRAFIHRAAGRSAEATRDFELTLEALAEHRARDDPEWLKVVHGHLGDLYYDAGDYARAAASYRRLRACYPEHDPFHATIQHWLGQCHVGLAEYAEARGCFERVLAAPNTPDVFRAAAEREVLSASAHLARRGGDHETAARLFDRLLAHHPEDDADRRRVLMWLGHSLYSLERFGEALTRYDEVKRSGLAEPDERAHAEEWAGWSTGRLQYEAGELADAAETFGRLVDRYPDDHEDRCTALLWLATCYSHLGVRTAAREGYAAVLAARTATESQRAKARDWLGRLDRDD
jgi:tetratricopeptide (TPR) repeat protein